MAGENEQIVRRFFDRQPEHKLSMTLGAGTRKMREQGIDFVDKEMERALSKTEGELKRLRQQLIIAWLLRKAGTHKIKGRHKLKSQELADLLNDEFGIPCTKIDVDNAKKKKVFVPHQVPSTELTREALKQLRRRLFPELVMEEFLTKKSAFNLDPAPLDQCPLNHLMSKPD